jgi:uncharacterized membrane protein YdjX (TVP38/TMEM64 family)
MQKYTRVNEICSYDRYKYFQKEEHYKIWLPKMAKSYWKYLSVSVLVIVVLIGLEVTDFGEKITLSSVQKAAFALKAQANANYWQTVLIFITVYVVVNLWFPAAAVITLLGGFLFGTILGTIYVDIAAVLGSVLPFWISRSFAGDWIQRRWSHYLKGFNKEISRRGYIYLMLVRMIPLMPYIVTNFLMGLTRIKTWTFIWTTALGSLPGIIVFCYLGRQLLTMKSIEDIYSSEVILAFVLLAIFVGSAIIIKKKIDKTLKEVSQ